MHWFRSHLPKHGYSPANTCAWGAGPFLVLAPGLGDTTLSESIHFFLSLQSFHGGKGLRNCRPGCSQSWFCHLLVVWFCPSSSQHQFPHLYCVCVHTWTCLLCVIPVGFSGQIIYDSINLQKPILLKILNLVKFTYPSRIEMPRFQMENGKTLCHIEGTSNVPWRKSL